MKILISEEFDQLVADTPDRGGMVPVGRGDTVYEALGRWLHNNRDAVGVTIDVHPSAMPAELRRRREELLER